MTPTRRRGRPPAATQHDPQPVRNVLIQSAPLKGIECPYCAREFVPRLEGVGDGRGYSTCPGCRARLALTFTREKFESVRLV